MNKKHPEDDKKSQVLMTNDDSQGDSPSDLNKLMLKMQNMMTKMDNIDTMDEDKADDMLQTMLGEVNNVTKSVQGQFRNLTQQLMNNPEIPEAEKQKYLGLEQNLGQLTNALSKGNSNPAEMEKTLNSLMGNLKSTMKDLNKDEEEDEGESGYADLEERVERLEERFAKLENIVRKIAEKLKK